MAKAGQRRSSEAVDVEEGRGTLTPEIMVRKFASAVLGLCVAHTKNFHDGEDIMQEVFLKAFTKLKTLRDETRARSWLLQIARRMCADYYRQRSSSRPVPDDLAARSDSSGDDITRLHEAISRLPDGYREPITLYYLDGRNCASVAAALGISKDAVRSRLVRARLRLHEILSEESYE
ncbi:MAG: RNA polymerase sigma factor [Planctomycetota bacterium]